MQEFAIAQVGKWAQDGLLSSETRRDTLQYVPIRRHRLLCPCTVFCPPTQPRSRMGPRRRLQLCAVNPWALIASEKTSASQRSVWLKDFSGRQYKKSGSREAEGREDMPAKVSRMSGCTLICLPVDSLITFAYCDRSDTSSCSLLVTAL
jgi:hypothetical protein